MGTPTSLSLDNSVSKKKPGVMLGTVAGSVKVVLADPACPVRITEKLPSARLDAPWRVKLAPPVGTARGKGVGLLTPEGKELRFTEGVSEVPLVNAFTVTVIVEPG
jgi:hypothetical protein